MEVVTNPDVLERIHSYPHQAVSQMLKIRHLILSTAGELEGNQTLYETFNWGEPSYVVHGGPSLGMDWKPDSPEMVTLFFRTKYLALEEFLNTLTPFGIVNEGIHIALDEPVPEKELVSCLKMTFSLTA